MKRGHFTKKQIFRKRAGSISLVICLLTGIISTILLLCFQAANVKAGEVRIVRAMCSAIEVNLAAYDNELKELYGLWGVKQNNISDQVFWQVIQPWQQDAEISLSAAEYTLAKHNLKKQITSYMQLRAPVDFLSGCVPGITDLNGIDQISLPGNSIIQNNQRKLLPESNISLSDIKYSDIREIQTYLQNNIFCYTPATLTVKAVRECIDWVLSPIFEPLKDALVNSVRERLNDAISKTLPVNPADFGVEQDVYLPELLQPEQISRAANLVEKLLVPSENQILQRFLISEYTLNSFTSGVQFTIENGEKVFRTTPGGIRHDQLAKSRENELEKIITGEENPAKAINRIKGNLIITRLIIRISQIIADNEKMQSYRPAASLLSALITAASAGTVMIDPEWLVWLVAASDAIRQAYSDYDHLIMGKYVPLWEKNGESFIRMNYHDYLRLFLLAQPEELILERIGAQISKVLPNNYVCEIDASVNWRTWQYNASSGY